MMQVRLQDEQKLAAHSSELQQSIDRIAEETSRLQQELKVHVHLPLPR
jgi:hypothetical protein